MEKYWEITSCISGIAGIAATAFCSGYFLKPFLLKKKSAVYVGFVYFAVMLVLYLIPYEMDSVAAYTVGALAVFGAMYAMERRNSEQKAFLAITVYILKWITAGIAIIPRNILVDLLLNSNGIAARPRLQLGMYITLEIMYILLNVFFMLFFANIINRKYIRKKENMTKSEFILMLSPLLSIVAGYWFFSFFERAYERDMKRYIWNVHTEYEWFLVLYQISAFAAILTAIIIFQKIKEAQREEKENAILERQMAEMRRHISGVEKLYSDIRSLKHDLGNHMMTLDNLYQKNEHEEARKYAENLKECLGENVYGIKTGNPVTDVILTEKKTEAKKREIAFTCEFFYPDETTIDVFDISIILNNAVNNAMEAAQGCKDPYISIISYRKKNAYMIEIENTSKRKAILNEDSGLPVTTKGNEQIHGFGIANIRKVARKYKGDIDIEQGEKSFKLSVMLMIK